MWERLLAATTVVTPELPFLDNLLPTQNKAMSQNTVSCDLHDYLEIACLYGYQVRLTLNDLQVVDGKAIDTLTTPDKREYLILDSGQKQQLELNQLKKMQVLTPNARFSEVDFQR